MALKTVTSENFEELVMKSDIPVLLDFWATWCGPCRMIAPAVEEVASERDDILVGKVNVDEAGDLAQSFGIQSIPTLVVIKDGKVAASSVGVIPKQKIIELIEG